MMNPTPLRVVSRASFHSWIVLVCHLAHAVETNESRPHFLFNVPHEAAVASVAFSPDGQFIATGCFNGLARIWDARSGKLLRSMGGGESALNNAVAFSPNGAWLASAGIHRDKTVKLWDMHTGALIRKFAGHEQMEVNAVCFSPDGKLLASAAEEVRLWETQVGKTVRTLKEHQGKVLCLAFSPDAETLATGGADRKVRLWRVADGKLLFTLDSHSHQVNAVAFSSDGSMLASAASHTRRSSGSRDASQPGEIVLWDARSGDLKQTRHETGRITSLAFLPDNKTLAAAVLNRVVLVNSADENSPCREFPAHPDELTALAVSRDGRTIASASFDRTVQVMEIATGWVKLRLPGCWDGVNSVAVSPDGKLFASASGDLELRDRLFQPGTVCRVFQRGEIRLWELGTARLVHTLVAGEQVTSIAFSPDGKTLASGGGNGSESGLVRLWRVSNGRMARTWDGHRSAVLSVAFSPNAAIVASGAADGVVKLWNAKTGSAFREIQGDGSWVESVAFAPDGKAIAVVTASKQLKLWSVADGSARWIVQAGSGLDPDRKSAVAFSPDGSRLATVCADRFVKLWDSRAGTLLKTFEEERNVERVSSVVFSPNGQTLISGGGAKSARLWDLSTGKVLWKVQHFHELTAVAFSPDGRRLVTGGEDRMVCLWDTQNGKLLTTSIVFPPFDAEKISSSWISFTPENFYTGSKGCARYIQWQRGDEIVSSKEFVRQFHEPDHVQAALRTGMPRR